FFQAEDGIRDSSVTGVQTCALPIFAPAPAPAVVTAPEYEVPRALVPVEPAPVDDQAVATRETWATPTALIGTRRVHRSCAEARRDGRVERVCALCVPVLTGGGRG